MTDKIIGISGKKRHGKDTTGKIIETLRPGQVVRIAYADALKMEVATMICNYSVDKSVEQVISEMNDDTIDPKTGEAVKEQYRLILQWWGTEFRRKMFTDSWWRDRVEEKLKTLDDSVIAVITDPRFVDEADQIKLLGGTMVRVVRPGMPDAGTHESEVALDDYASFDFHLTNDGPEYDYLTSLTPQVETFLKTYGY